MKTNNCIPLTISLIVIPMFLGGMIYTIYRPQNLIMFSWFEILHCNRKIELLRKVICDSNILLPKWVIYSLPNALWVFSGVISFQLIWQKKIKQMYFWISIFVFVAIMFEVSQLLNIIPGVFDFIDILLILISVALANLYFLWLFKQEGI